MPGTHSKMRSFKDIINIFMYVKLYILLVELRQKPKARRDDVETPNTYQNMDTSMHSTNQKQYDTVQSNDFMQQTPVSIMAAGANFAIQTVNSTGRK